MLHKWRDGTQSFYGQIFLTGAESIYKMNISYLKSLHQHPKIKAWLVSEPINVPYFDGKPLTFTLDGLTDADENDAQKAIEAFLKLNSEMRMAASQYVFQNYRRMADAVGEDEIDCHVKNPNDIWTHVHPSEIYVSRRDRRDKLIYIQITAECDWEREHGLQIIYRQGNELSRVSDQDGHLTYTDAYDLPEEQDKIAG
jgi:hypothetical protein